MYHHLRGKLVDCVGDRAIVEVNGVGYLLAVGSNFHLKSPAIGSDILLFTELVIKADAHELYGFLTKNERELFLLLQTVSGIGPKSALGLISFFSPHDLAQAIASKNVQQLSKSPGIGKKSAERLVLELQEKVMPYLTHNDTPPHRRQLVEEAVQALQALGMAKQQATQAVMKSVQNRPEVQDITLLLQLALAQPRV